MQEQVMIFDAFRLHDENGLTLDIAHDMAKAMDVEINSAAFACDALGSGWNERKTQKIIRQVYPDIDWIEFMKNLSILWTLAGSFPSPECWRLMKQFIVETPQRPDDNYV